MDKENAVLVAILLVVLFIMSFALGYLLYDEVRATVTIGREVDECK